MTADASVQITFFVPCYNEARNVEGALNVIETLMKNRALTYEILVVDDGSSDGTSEVVKAYCSSHPAAPIIIHRNPKNLGLGRNYFLASTRGRGKYYMLINGDNETSVDDFARILEQLGKADMIVPYLANQTERPLIRTIISCSFNSLVSLLSGHRLKYYNGPVLHRRENVIRFAPKASGFTYQSEILCQALAYGCSFVEVPMYYMKIKNKDMSSIFRFVNIASSLKCIGRMFLNRLKVTRPAVKSFSS